MENIVFINHVISWSILPLKIGGTIPVYPKGLLHSPLDTYKLKEIDVLLKPDTQSFGHYTLDVYRLLAE